MCEGLALALRTYGVPAQILTDNGKVFTGRFNRPPVEVLFDRVCRENGIEHLLTQPRSPTTTGKIERFHRAIRTEFRTDRVFASLAAAQAELDEWVDDYNHQRPHQALDMVVPGRTVPPHASRPLVTPMRTTRDSGRPAAGRGDGTWVARRASARRGVRELATGLPRRRRRRPNIDVWVTDQVLQFYDGDQLLRTEQRTRRRGGEEEEGIGPRRPYYQ